MARALSPANLHEMRLERGKRRSSPPPAARAAAPPLRARAGL
jgi:hypothetical protein